MLADNKYADTDKLLTKKMAKGDQFAFAELYKRHHTGIYNFLFKFTKTSSLTEDLVHDVFLKLWEARSDIVISSSFSAYLYTTARNKAIDHLRRIVREHSYQDELLHKISLGLIDHTSRNDYEWRHYQQLLKKALANLSPQRKEAFVLIKQEGKSYQEAGELMGISRNTLKQHLMLAVQSIKEFLKENGDILISIILIYLA